MYKAVNVRKSIRGSVLEIVNEATIIHVAFSLYISRLRMVPYQQKVMEPYTRLPGDNLIDSLFAWDKKLTTRRQTAYRQEDNRLQPSPQQTIVDAFLKERIDRLYPVQYSYTALRNYVSETRLSDLTGLVTPIEHSKKLVLLDDRRDPSGGALSTRNWDAYTSYPPEGEQIWTRVLDAVEFYRRLMERVLLPLMNGFATRAQIFRGRAMARRDGPCMNWTMK